jgi:phage terminase small subunit
MAALSQRPAALERRHRKFAQAYVACGYNASEAARIAGYSPKTAGLAGHVLLKRQQVRALIRDIADQTFDPIIMPAKEVLARASLIARVDPASLYDNLGNMLPMDQIPPEVRAAMESIKTALAIKDSGDGQSQTVLGTKTVKFASKLGALRFLGEYHGLVRGSEPQSAPPPPVDNPLDVARRIAFALMRASAIDAEAK